MAGTQNLIPYTTDQSREEASKNGTKGGIASGKSRRDKKTYQMMAQHLLDMQVPDTIKTEDGKEIDIKETIKQLFPKLKDEDITNRVAQLFILMKKSLQGDIRAIEIMRDTSGEKPTDLDKDKIDIPTHYNRNEVKEFANELRKGLDE